MVYYNENDPKAAAWLRELIKNGHIADGVVDERSIVDVRAADVAGFVQCHFFAGIGGWSYALRLAGWSDDRPVWTGSCPCQPFSAAGNGEGFNDPRHLWPELKRLIALVNPPIIFGEQVASAASWLGLVRSDLEEMEYAVGAIPIQAACAGAYHLRDRYWFVAHAKCYGRDGRRQLETMPSREVRHSSCGEDTGHLGGNAVQWIADASGKKYRLPRDVKPVVDGLPEGMAVLRGIGNAIVPQVAAEFIAAALKARTSLTTE